MALDIARGRLAFPFYYEHANQSEVDLFDALYLAHIGLSIGINTPRDALTHLFLGFTSTLIPKCWLDHVRTYSSAAMGEPNCIRP